ncbi:hypothetical protein CKO11_05320 [Rhodobacter sp. TJ_12]|uniref:hypothetical protein n=1 Tax=Rhodobacter sp. TJ_12 TaxID=2029399 RepID=UPI001CBE40D6|nr:hypothetical protein [Rhodobacter sp. TJ_12]MBZ4021878.1 hypothetical protein [Rhodobacter sp. TJ_12]
MSVRVSFGAGNKRASGAPASQTGQGGAAAQSYAQMGACEIVQGAPGSFSAVLTDWSKPERAGRLLRFDAGPEGG